MENDNTLLPGTLVNVNVDYHARGGNAVIVSQRDDQFFCYEESKEFLTYNVLYDGKVIPMYRYEFDDIKTDLDERPFVAHKGIWRKEI
jgi:hypothetical protein